MLVRNTANVLSVCGDLWVSYFLSYFLRASWCPPCLGLLPAYDKMYMELGNAEFEFIAINVDEDTDNGIFFLEDHPVTYPVLADPEGDRHPLQGKELAGILSWIGKAASFSPVGVSSQVMKSKSSSN